MNIDAAFWGEVQWFLTQTTRTETIIKVASACSGLLDVLRWHRQAAQDLLEYRKDRERRRKEREEHERAEGLERRRGEWSWRG